MPETIKVVVDRNSVAMGDDVESHLEFWIFPASATVDDLLTEISAHYLPSVAGPAGWEINIDTHERRLGRAIGLIYKRDDLKQQAHVCRLTPGRTMLRSLTRLAELGVYANYLSGDKARPVALSEMTAGPAFTGSRPTKLESEAQAQANTDWVLMRELDRRAAAIEIARVDWVRATLASRAVPPPGSDIFIARNFHFLTELHCPASLNIAASLLGTDESLDEGVDALPNVDDRAATVTLAMVLAAFEWGTRRQRWQVGERPYCRAYFEFLARWGYQLSPIEQVMAGHMTVEQFRFSANDLAKLDRIRQLREAQYTARVRRYYAKTLSDEEYQAAIRPIHDELTALGEKPGPI
ncbi:hypothetical protein [Mycobacterium sp. IS-1264]|uniref:hypothetical protein n=1 Tax=Mycobacterium sp. IS-1264 TaxID=1834158 RepID=UPI00096C0DCB|nr:hypothetical protein [Mycobacterium sp. IS-1264]OMC43795.1 hypothetical protein A5744_13325 [Mycobacterium sp. IS-1264]